MKTAFRSHLRWLQCLVVVPVLHASACAWAQSSEPAKAVFVPARVKNQTEGRVADFPHVLIRGEITADTPKDLSAALEKARKSTKFWHPGGAPAVNVFLDSPGGRVGAAVAIGRILRANAANVWIDSDATCASACIFMLAGGVERWTFDGARLGLHRPFLEPELFAGLSYEDAQKKYGQVAAVLRDYLQEMGVSVELYEMMMRVPSQDVFELDFETAERVGLLGKDAAFAEWDRARHQRRMAKYDQCVKRGGTELDCSRQIQPR